MDENRDLKNRIEKLEIEVQRIKRLYEKTLYYQNTDPEVSLSQARKSAEAICKQIYINNGLHKSGKDISKLMLNDFIQGLDRNKILPRHIIINLYTIQAFGNFGAHDQGGENEVITEEYVKPCMQALGTVFNWYVNEYHKRNEDKILDEKEAENSTLNTEKNGDTIIIVGNNAPPYRIFEGETVKGIYFDIIKEIGKRIGVDLKFIKRPFKRALQMMKSGEADIMIGPNRNEEREEYMIYINTTLPSEKKAFYMNPLGKPVCSYEDLFDKTLILERGRSYTKEIGEDNRIRKIYISDYLTGIDMLLKKTDCVLVMPEKEGDYLLEENDLDLITCPYSIDGEESYIAISKKSSKLDLIEKIESALQDMIEDGAYEEIIKSY